VNFRIASSILPVATFYILSRVADPWVSIAGGFVASSLVFYWNRRHRVIGLLAAFAFVVLTLSAVIGVIFESEKAYLASGPVADFLFVPMFLASMLLKKPLIGGIVREMFPQFASQVPIHAPVFVSLSVLWAIGEGLTGLLRAYLLYELSVGEYIIWSRLATWPLRAIVVGITIWAVYRASKEYPAAAVEEVTEAIEARRAATVERP
jgi:hypothetical protein